MSCGFFSLLWTSSEDNLGLVESIAEDLWEYIELVKNKYPTIDIKYYDLANKIVDWFRKYDSVRIAMEETAITKKRSKKNAKKRSK